ncbi:MAG: 5-deoxy-glucuronate isomerase [Actinomycetia bacterium]|nr:5-deoxy-glucuronate isomerase [Actinomycetes bacterium]
MTPNETVDGQAYYKPGTDQVRLTITPETAGWTYLDFEVVAPGAGYQATAEGREVAVVPLSGAGTATVDGTTYELARTSVFEQMPHVLYVPPGHTIDLAGNDDFEVSLGSAPAEGKYPVRLFRPDEMKSEMRGGGASYRQVNHVLAPPLPAERLILYEVYVPRGTWSGWAPHCHDGYDGSPYLEEVYYFRLDPAEGFAMHRNWRVDQPFDETFVAGDKDCVTVRKGYHSSVAAPSSHMFFLNYLAGELYDTERRTPPCFHPDFTWIQDDWTVGDRKLPFVTP